MRDPHRSSTTGGKLRESRENVVKFHRSVKMVNSIVKKITIFRSKRHKTSNVVKKMSVVKISLKKGKRREIGYTNKGLPLILSVDPTYSPNVKDSILTSAHKKCEIFHFPC